MRVIINADDCGINANVNQHIEQAINEGKITSTTIMANMEDFEGALTLYERYHDYISYGIHLNLTEGEPLLKSKVLLEYGYYVEKEGRLFFDGKSAESFRYKSLPSNIKAELYKELSAQISKVMEGGVRVSHLDSHHHIHTSLSLMSVLAQLSKDFDIPKVRNIRNYVKSSVSFGARNMWTLLSRIYNHHYIMTDYFAIFDEFFKDTNIRKIRGEETLELMIHPGNPGKAFQHEEELMYEMSYPPKMELINYNML